MIISDQRDSSLADGTVIQAFSAGADDDNYDELEGTQYKQDIHETYTKQLQGIDREVGSLINSS